MQFSHPPRQKKAQVSTNNAYDHPTTWLNLCQANTRDAVNNATD